MKQYKYKDSKTCAKNCSIKYYGENLQFIQCEGKETKIKRKMFMTN